MTSASERPRVLAERVEAALAESARDFARYALEHHPDAGAAYVDLDSGVACFGGRYAGPNVGRCWGWGMGGPPSDADLDAAEAFHAQSGHEAAFFVNPYADPGLVEKLQTRGYVQRRLEMVLCGTVPHVLAGAPPDRLRQVSLDDERDQALITRVYREVYGVEAPADIVLGNAEALAHGTNTASFVLEDEDEFLGLCAIWSAGDVAYLLGSGVLPPHRGQGRQLELAHGRLRWAAARGAEMAFVIVPPGSASETNMRRLGLSPAWTSAVWERAGGP